MSDRQAIWVALRTLRQRPTVVDRTDEGATVYEVRSVRLVLPAGATHFKRLMACAKCGRSVPGPAVLAPTDLDRPPNPIFCERCVRSPVPPRPEIRDAGAPVPKPAAPAAVPSPRPGADDAEGLQGRTEGVAGVLPGQNAELAKLKAAVVEVRAEMRQLAARVAAQAEASPAPAIEATLARELADVRAGLAAMVDATTQPLEAALAHGLDRLRAQIAALQQRIDDESAARSDVAQLAEANRALAHAQGQLDEKVGELAAQVKADPVGTTVATLASEVADVRARLVALDDAMAQPVPAAPTDGLEHLRAQVATLQQRIDDESTARSEMAQVAEVTRALAQAQRELDQKQRQVAAQLASLRGADAEADAVRGRDLADLRAEVAATIGAEESQLRVELADRLEDLRGQFAGLLQRIDDESGARSEIGQVAEANRALAQAHGDLDQRVSELAAQLAGLPGDDPEAVGAPDVAELRADLEARIGAEDTQLRVALAEGLQLLRAEIASVEQRNREELAAVAALLEAQRKDLTEMVHDVAHETLMSVAEPLRDLTRGREETERRLEGLRRRTEEDQRKVEALTASASAGASRLYALEQRLYAGVQRLIHPTGTEPGAQQPPPASEGHRRPPVTLVESLERQLREAEERLSQL